MELEHSFTIPVPPEQAWQVLLDVERIAPCMPGATVDAVEGDVVKGRIKVKVGPVSLTYSGTARFVEKDEKTRTVVLEGSGKDTRGSGTASATVRSTLQDEGGGQTRVTVHTSMTVTGRPAQFGRGVMAEVGGRIIEKFATNLAALLAGEGPPETGVAASNGAGPGASASGPAAAGTATAGTAPASTAPASTAAAGAGAAGGPQGAADGAVPLEELQLPVRAYNSLRRTGIRTVDDLSARTEAELLAIENLGPQSVREIKQRLAGFGRHLADQAAEGAAGSGARAAAGPVPAAAGPAAGANGAAPPAGAPAAGADGAAGPAHDGAGAQAATAQGATAQGAGSPGANRPSAPRAARPPDEDAIDLLSVAGFPVLKRALPVVGVLVVLLLVILGIRGRRRG
jgi:carbon monoxide dehydrogenase subunit G